MNQENQNILKTRIKSFAWRLSVYIGVAVVGFLGQNSGLFISDPTIVAVIALVCGEITKFLNTQKVIN